MIERREHLKSFLALVILLFLVLGIGVAVWALLFR